MTTLSRAGRGLALALALVLSSPSPSPAQDDLGTAAPAEGGQGKPLYGYLAVGAGCIAIIFIICISARR